jgi:hypothetical protein
VKLAFDGEQRLEAALSIARRVRDPLDSLGVEARERLLASAGLSREGLELALTQHLEIDASAADRARLSAWAMESERCHVVLSANVVTAAFRAIVLGLLSAPHVLVKASRREPELARLLVGEIAPLLESGSLSLVDSLEAQPGDQVHAYGSDTTLAAIAAALPAGARFRGHGSGFGVAVIDATADVEPSARSLARDVVAFDQRGCLSPRVAMALGGPARARSVALALHEALADLGRKIPRGDLDESTRAELARFRQTMRALGDVWEERDHLVALDTAPAALVLPPAARAVSVLACSDLSVAARIVAPVSRWITSLGIASASDAAAFDALHPRGCRVARLGEMQRPPLDGPVDERER